MSEENGKVCCNCRHNIRISDMGNIRCKCEIHGFYIGYVACFEHWCRHWARDKKFDKQEEKQ